MGTRKLLALFGGICLVLILVVSLTGWVSALGLAKEAPDSEMVLPPSITPVVILQGSDYEMGCQYGQQAGQWIEPEKDALWASALKNYSYDEVLHQLKVGQYYVRMYTPEQIETMKGIADGATAAGYALSYLDVLMLNGCRLTPKPDYPYPPEAEEEELPPSCSAFAAWGSATTDGCLIGADSTDGTFGYNVAIVAFPDVGNSYITLTSPGKLSAEPCMNSKGVFIGGTAGYAQRSIDEGYGLPWSCRDHHLMRFADSAEEVVDMLLSMKVEESECVLVADVSGDAYVVELTNAIKTVREPGDFGETDFIYATNNFLTDEMQVCGPSEIYIEHGGWWEPGWFTSSICRNMEMWNMFHNYQGEVDLDFAKMMWRFPSVSPLYPLDIGAYYDPTAPILAEGWDQHILNLMNNYVGIGLPDDGDEGVMYVCTGPAGRVVYPMGPIPMHHDFYQIDGTHTFYQLALSSSPAKVVSAAQYEAHINIAEAYQELMWLNYTDTGFTGLNELYSLANTEYYEGDYWTNQAMLASGNQALLYFAQAATAFTRAQAHALEVLHALVPPATSPEDLGLKPWFGPWADWATRF